MGDEPRTFRTAEEAAEYLPAARTIVDRFARAHPGIVVHDNTVVVSRHTMPPVVSFMIWLPHSKSHGCSVISYDASRSAAEIIDDVEKSLSAGKLALKELWLDELEDNNPHLFAAAIAFAGELAGALDPARFGVPGGILMVREGANRYRAEFTVTIFVGDKTYNVDESADLTITAAQSAALVIARLDRRREELLGEGWT
jgi:hypothetical protein